MVVRLGIVGCGRIAQLFHISSALRAKNAKLVALCDVLDELVERVANRYNIARYYTDYKEMLEKENIDALINCTPPSEHVAITEYAASAGKHVLVEKPMAVTIEQCERMIEVCEENRVQLMVGFMKRFDPTLEWVKKLVASDQLGNLFVINSYCYDTVMHNEYVRVLHGELIRSRKAGPPRREIAQLPLLLGYGIHYADLLTWIGGHIEAVNSLYKQNDHTFVSSSILEFRNHSLGYLQLAGWVTKDWEEGLIIHGTKGSVEATLTFPFFKAPSKATAYFLDRKEYVSKCVPARNMYLSEVQHFVDCLAENKPPSPNGYDGLEAQKVIYAIHRSASEMKRIEIS